jgi:stage IV sporulation protein FA
MNEIDRIRNKIRGKKTKKNYFNVINKFMFVILITIITLILLKSNPTLKEKFYRYVYDNNISFVNINNLYKKYFGDVLPSNKEKTKQVFDEKINYSKSLKYKDGVKLDVGPNYLVPALNSGMVIYIGNKDEYGSTVVIEQTDGVEVWYSNVKTNLKMYDYIEKGTNVGEADNTLYLVFKKDGAILNYEDYI